MEYFGPKRNTYHYYLEKQVQDFVHMDMKKHTWFGIDNVILSGEAHIVSISCGSQTVWAVDSDGQVFQRLGVKPASSYQLNPAWLPIPSTATIFFTHVATGPEDFMVRM